ncbi:hypothetical protein CXB37_27450 [Pseudomonas syringae pv. syringae]|nr:hypothetical protein CXB37_27450 [Pseudomonas syringae pv. syringae]
MCCLNITQIFGVIPYAPAWLGGCFGAQDNCLGADLVVSQSSSYQMQLHQIRTMPMQIMLLRYFAC